MKIIGIIPARYESSRFPGKPLIDLKGKTMIQRVYEGAKKSKMLNEVIVATDDLRIKEEVLRFGGKVVMTSKDHLSGTDRCGEVAAEIDCDVVINIQGDEPLVDSRQLDILAASFGDSDVQISTLGINDSDPEHRFNPNRIKVVTDSKNRALYFSRSPIPNTDRASVESMQNFPFLRHIGIYAYRKEVLIELIELEPTDLEHVEALEQLRWMYHGYHINVVETDIETPNIDVPEDIEKVLNRL